jgi:hypothetical protein
MVEIFAKVTEYSFSVDDNVDKLNQQEGGCPFNFFLKENIKLFLKPE